MKQRFLGRNTPRIERREIRPMRTAEIEAIIARELEANRKAGRFRIDEAMASARRTGRTMEDWGAGK